MRCRDIREQVSAYVDGEIAGADAEKVRNHLEACPSCRALASRMRALGVGVERIEAPLSPSFRDDLFARLEREELLPRRRSLFAFSLRWLAVPAAAAAAAALFLFTQGPSEGPADRVSAPGDARVAGGTAPGTGTLAAAPLTAEEREILAYLEILENPQIVEEPSPLEDPELSLRQFPAAERG